MRNISDVEIEFSMSKFASARDRDIAMMEEIVRLRADKEAFAEGIHTVVASNVALEKQVAAQSETICKLMVRVRL